MGIDIEEHVVARRNKSNCSAIQLNVLTDVSNLAILFWFVKYIRVEGFKDKFLCYHELLDYHYFRDKYIKTYDLD